MATSKRRFLVEHEVYLPTGVNDVPPHVSQLFPVNLGWTREAKFIGSGRRRRRVAIVYRRTIMEGKSEVTCRGPRTKGPIHV